MRREPVNFLDRETERVTPKRKRVLFLIGFISILLFFVGGCINKNIISSNNPKDPGLYDPVTLEPLQPEGFLGKIKQFVFGKNIKLEGEKKDRINLLLLGQGGIGHDGPFLTDTIIIVSIKPSTNQISFVSIPRDLSVNIPGHGIRKVNHANAFGEANEYGSGSELAKKIIEDTFDLDIHYYARVDFAAFEEIVDEIGGVRVNIDRSFVDNQYPAPHDEYQVISFKKGTQTMDGETALTFARSRHGNNGEGSDFARSKRQQKIILALKEKILSFGTLANPIKINGILDSLDDHVITSMEFTDIITFLRMARELDTSNIITLTLDNAVDGYLKNGYSPQGSFILEPVSGNFDDINTAIATIFENPPEIQKDNTPKQQKPEISYTGANIEIQNGTWHAGMAARIRQKLIREKFAITTIGNTIERPQTDSGIYIINASTPKDIIEALKQELHISIKQSIPKGETPTSTTDILVILGENFEE
jgi:polyisoprenyl-teichoic acid--peptidoglycan teichoic acid transferase